MTRREDLCYSFSYDVKHWERCRMRVKLKLFAIYREKVGQSELEMSVTEGSTAGEVLDRLVSDYPSLAGMAAATMFAVDEDFATAQTVLRDGQELALLPPVSGG